MQTLWLSLGGVWVLGELLLTWRTRGNGSACGHSTSDLCIWATVLVSVALALIAKNIQFAPLPGGVWARHLLGLLLFAIGIGLRLVAVLILGRYFSTQVSVLNDHMLILTGPYSKVRHPAYSGLLLAFVGAGIAMGDFFALALLCLPVFIVLRKRIFSEERFLHQSFGGVYQAYVAQTYKLIPWLY